MVAYNFFSDLLMPTVYLIYTTIDNTKLFVKLLYIFNWRVLVLGQNTLSLLF